MVIAVIGHPFFAVIYGFQILERFLGDSLWKLLLLRPLTYFLVFVK